MYGLSRTNCVTESHRSEVFVGGVPARVSDGVGAPSANFLRIKGDALGYRYDFGDFLERAIVVDNVLTGTSTDPSAASLAPVRLCQRIAGGIKGYAGLLEAWWIRISLARLPGRVGRQRFRS